jgi:hypothetical protein
MRIFSIVLIALFSFYCSAQSPYSLHKKKDLLLVSSTLVIGGTSLLFNTATTSLSNTELDNLSTQSINILDRSATKNQSTSAAKLSDYGVFIPSALSGISVFAIPKLNKHGSRPKEIGTLGIIWFETNLACAGITNLTINTVKRVRP